MIHLIEWDDESDAVHIHDGGRREPRPGELSRLAEIIDIKPRAMVRLEIMTVIAALVAAAVFLRGGGA